MPCDSTPSWSLFLLSLIFTHAAFCWRAKNFIKDVFKLAMKSNKADYCLQVGLRGLLKYSVEKG